MKSIYLLLIACMAIGPLVGQSSKVPKTVQIISPRKIELNGGLRSQFGGKSRGFIEVDLPPKTIEWYYSFTTSTSGSGQANLNLALQLGGMLVAGSTGLPPMAFKAVQVPKGVASADIYLFDRKNIQLFIDKADQNGVRPVPVTNQGINENMMDGTIRITDVKAGKVYLGLRNPSSIDGLSLTIEVVAIVEPDRTAEDVQAELFGNMGWKAYERGEYDVALEFNQKALALNPDLSWVYNNNGLIKLIKGDLAAAIEQYGKAIALYKQSDRVMYYINASIKDLEMLILKYPGLNGAMDILLMLRREDAGK